MKLRTMRAKYTKRGYSSLNAMSRVCQDVLLAKIAASAMKDYVTVKGGVLMCALSGSSRRATQDIDLDFIRYPLSDSAIHAFVEKLSSVDDGISLCVVGPIEDLSQEDYKGKRVLLELRDGHDKFVTKLDLGVHASLCMEQDECWFDIAQSDEGVCLLANSKEQLFAEKLKSLLLHGIRSTRFRDLYDMYYIAHRADFDKERLRRYIDAHIIEDSEIWDSNVEDVVARIKRTLSNKAFLSRMKSSHKDWIGKSPEEVARWLPKYLEGLR